MSDSQEGFPFFSDQVVRYVREHAISPLQDQYADPYRAFGTTWLASSVLKERVPGNILHQFKLDGVRSWLTDPSKLNKEGLPIISIGCYSGSFILIEGNHRARVLMEDLKVQTVPVQVQIYEDGWENPMCLSNRFATQEEWEEFDNKLLSILFDQGFTRCHLWNKKEVWRASLPLVFSELILKEKMTHSPLVRKVTLRKDIYTLPVIIPDYVWEHHLDPIDKEIYELLEEHFPKGYSAETLLVKLKEMNPEENEDYRLQDVWDAIDISLKDYVEKKGKGFWVLKKA